MTSIGIMDPAFFVGKNQILKWMNDFFQTSYTKIEQACSGAIHCQIMDAIYPGKVPLHKVNFDAKHDYEYVANYKILQSVFASLDIPKHIEVEKLIKGKYQDNLEMLQWMKNFFETKYGGQDYNAKERREQAQAAYRKAHKHATAGNSAAKKAPAASAPTEGKAAPVKREVAPPKPVAKAPAKIARAAAPSHKVSDEIGSKKDDVNGLREQISKLTLAIEGLEKERNFYFSKLREIEILCQTDETVEAATKQAVLKILYHTDDNDEFQSPADAEGEGAETGLAV